MKKIKYVGILAAFTTAIGLSGCTDDISTNLGATRNNDAYDYDYSGGGYGYGNRTGIGGTQGAGYWDYYGINDGVPDTVANDLTGAYVRPNSMTDGTYGYEDIYGNNRRYVKRVTPPQVDNNAKDKVDAPDMAN